MDKIRSLQGKKLTYFEQSETRRSHSIFCVFVPFVQGIANIERRIVRLNRFYNLDFCRCVKHTWRLTPLTVRKLEGTQTKLLQKIKESLDRLNEKMEVIIELQKHSSKENPEIPDVLDVMTLLSLPDHLRKTAITICKLDQATAEEVAEQTKRARAVESSYLNQLVMMGYLKKERRGRKAYFYVDKEEAGNKKWQRS